MTRVAADQRSCAVAIIYNVVDDWERIDINSVLDGVAHVHQALEALGHRVSLLRVNDGVRPLVERLEAIKPDVVFNLCEGYRERSAGEYCVAGLLELLGLPYTGSGPIALAVALEKPLAKQLFIARGIPTPRFAVYAQMPSDPPPLAFPVILKLAGEDASLGITSDSVVFDWSTCLTRLRGLLDEHHVPVLAEEFIDGREFTVALLDGEPISVEEIQFAVEPRILCFRAKWAAGSAEDRGTPCVFAPSITDAQRHEIVDLAVQVWDAIGMRDYGRVDFRQDARGRLFVLEANPNPDITSASGYRSSLDAAHISYPEFIARLLDRALQRRPG